MQRDSIIDNLTKEDIVTILEMELNADIYKKAVYFL